MIQRVMLLFALCWIHTFFAMEESKNILTSSLSQFIKPSALIQLIVQADIEIQVKPITKAKELSALEKIKNIITQKEKKTEQRVITIVTHQTHVTNAYTYKNIQDAFSLEQKDNTSVEKYFLTVPSDAHLIILSTGNIILKTPYAHIETKGKKTFGPTDINQFANNVHYDQPEIRLHSENGDITIEAIKPNNN